MKKLLPAIAVALLSGMLATGVASADDGTPNGAAVASAHHLATDAGLDMLAQGGNAFDAAVAVSATLSVVEPISSGLGGGGFFLLHDAASGQDVFVDAREVAPASATPEAYLDADGELDRDRATNGPWSAGIPGLPAALVHGLAEFEALSEAVTNPPADNPALIELRDLLYEQQHMIDLHDAQDIVAATNSERSSDEQG